jgi:hypothetical protein
MKRVLLVLACWPCCCGLRAVDLNASMPTFDTVWTPRPGARIPAGEFYSGQHNEVKNTQPMKSWSRT